MTNLLKKTIYYLTDPDEQEKKKKQKKIQAETVYFEPVSESILTPDIQETECVLTPDNQEPVEGPMRELTRQEMAMWRKGIIICHQFDFFKDDDLMIK